MPSIILYLTDLTAGTGTWSNETEALGAPGGLEASCEFEGKTTCYCDVTFEPLVLPAGAVYTGCQVKLYGSAPVAEFVLDFNADAGDFFSSTPADSFPVTSTVTAADPSQAELESGFTRMLTINQSTGSPTLETFNIDAMALEVFYTLESSGNRKRKLDRRLRRLR